MTKLSLEDAIFLKDNSIYLTNVKKLRDGIIKPKSDKHKRFLEVLKNLKPPKTKWERAFLHWTEMNEPNLNWYILDKIKQKELERKKVLKKEKLEKKKVIRKSRNKSNFSTNSNDCSVCNSLIPMERLRLVPNTTMCVQCASKDPNNKKNRFIKNEFGSRADYKRDRGGWRKNNI